MYSAFEIEHPSKQEGRAFPNCPKAERGTIPTVCVHVSVSLQSLKKCKCSLASSLYDADSWGSHETDGY